MTKRVFNLTKNRFLIVTPSNSLIENDMVGDIKNRYLLRIAAATPPLLGLLPLPGSSSVRSSPTHIVRRKRTRAHPVNLRSLPWTIESTHTGYDGSVNGSCMISSLNRQDRKGADVTNHTRSAKPCLSNPSSKRR